MTSWVIVAIPSEDDPVWKISSEKVPHLTILFLGDQSDESKVVPIMETLSHVAKTSLDRFGLSVDRRGKLGPEDADVLFFEKDYARRLAEARGYLLEDETISKMFNSVEQYPEWTPHLTLGYPATPAHPSTQDYPISWVNFDRLAIWTGDYEGPEVLLNRNDQAPMEVSMSTIDPIDNVVSSMLAHRGASDVEERKSLDDFLAHFGVKGMRWGVRRAVDSSGHVERTGTEGHSSPHTETQVSADHERAAKAFVKSQEKGIHALSNEELKAITSRAESEKKFHQLTNGQKSALELEVERMRLEKDLRSLKSERAKATRSTGQKVLDSMMSSLAKVAQDQASAYGKKMVEEMIYGKKAPSETDRLKKEIDSLKVRKEHRTLKRDLFDLGERRDTGPFKVNPAKIKIGPT